MSEMSNLLPVYAMYEPQVRPINTEDTYVYVITRQQPQEKSEKRTYTSILPVFHFCETSMYRSPKVNNNTLRAPPILILDC